MQFKQHLSWGRWFKYTPASHGRMSSPCWARGVAAAGPKASPRGDTELQGRDRTAETLKYSQSLSCYIPFSFLGQLSTMGITGKVPKLTHPTRSSDRHCAPSPKLLQVPLQLAGKLYQDSRDYQGNFGEDQPKSSYFYIIDKVLKFLLAAGGLSVPRRAVPLPRARGEREQWWEIQFIQDSDRQHWCSSQGQECLLILRGKKRELEVCWKEWGWEGWAGRGILPSVVRIQSLFLQIQNSLCIYYRIMFVFITELLLFTTDLLWGSIQAGAWVLLCQKREARGWAQYKTPGKGCILVFTCRWILHKGG